ncbi:Asp23/Gls24 family envelope stress response protein [Kineococcus terrestris]|uniref:Asp23/Gls24 family envelope stress response protein n=1 Tax=Kineococcus terrestris TaxID=2044856 RepID=UPI0034DAED29
MAETAVATAPEQRGRLVVHDRVVQRIAEAAAAGVPGTTRTGGTGSGGAGARVAGALDTVLGRAYPSVDCTVAGHRARLRVQVAAVWPHPAAQVAAAVRDAVRDAVTALAATTVDAVEVTVATYVTAERAGTTGTRRVQ